MAEPPTLSYIEGLADDIEAGLERFTTTGPVESFDLARAWKVVAERRGARLVEAERRQEEAADLALRWFHKAANEARNIRILVRLRET